MVAKALGRTGISVDMSADYCRLAEWRCNDRDQLAKVLGIENVEQPHRDDVPLFDLESDGPTRPSGGIGYANAKGRTCVSCGYRSQRPSGCEKCGSDLGGAA